jgi:ATP-dependent helicase/nuclease subunit B
MPVYSFCAICSFAAATRNALRAHARRFRHLLSEYTREQSDALLDKLCGDYDEQIFLTGPYRLDGRQRHLAHWHRMRLKNDCWQMKKQLQKDGFQPFAFETSFERSIPLQDGREANVKGRIDRIDLATPMQKHLVRVVDYKTGATSFSYTDLYYGTALQLPLYSAMAAGKANGKSVGMFMQQLRKNPGYCAPEAAESEREKSIRLNGTYTPECAEAVGMAAGEVLVGGENNARVMSDDEYDRSLAYGYERARELMQQRVSGVTSPDPLKGAIDGCEFCDFTNTCGYEVKNKGRPCQRMDRAAYLSAITLGGKPCD